VIGSDIGATFALICGETFLLLSISAFFCLLTRSLAGHLIEAPFFKFDNNDTLGCGLSPDKVPLSRFQSKRQFACTGRHCCVAGEESVRAGQERKANYQIAFMDKTFSKAEE
jgi:hypothetical protein